MKHKIFILSIVLVFVSNLNLFSQEKMSDLEQISFKEKVQKTAQSTKSIQSNFMQTKQLSVLDNAIVSEGHLTFKAPNLVKWEYTKPYKNIAIFKNDKLLVNNEGNKDEMDLSSNGIFRSLNTLIVNSIKGDMFDKSQFQISYFKIGQDYLVKFIPKDKRMKKFISSFELKFDKESTQVNEVKMIEPNNDYTLIVFKNKKLNGMVSDSVFIN